MTIAIRKMTAHDHRAWTDMRVQLWARLSEAEHLAEIAQWTGNGKLTGYAAFRDGQAIGFAEVSLRDYANGCRQRPVPFLEGIWIAPAHRRQGTGRMLLDAIGEDLRAAGFSELCSDAEVNNSTSRAAHGDWGFQEVETVVCYRKPLT